MARAMAEHDETVVQEAHLKDSVAMRGQFLEDVRGAGALQNQDSYL